MNALAASAVVASVLREIGDVQECREEDVLAELMDSLELIECVVVLEERLDRDFTDDRVEKLRTVGDLLRLVEGAPA